LDQAAPTTATFTLDYDNTKKIDGRILEGFSFDGDDKIIMTSTPTNVKGVTYWKKNNTDSAWKFHANITGSLYENGISVPANSFQTFVEGKTIGIAKNKYFNGTIDDIALWNKTLTASDVMNLFLAGANGGYILSNSITRYSETIKAGTKICNASTCSGELNTTILTVDSSTPQVSLLSPVDNDHDNSANPSFTFVALDDDLTNCSFYHNASGTWSLNQTDITPYSNNISVNTFALQFSTGDTKSFVWNVECADLANQKSFAGQNFTYTTDLADPIITWNTPKSDNSTKTNSNIPFSVDFNNTNLYAYDLNITNSSGSIIYSNGSVNLPPVYYRLADYLNMSGQYGEQNITSTISLSDSHTTSTIGDYNPKTSDKDLTFSDKTNKMEFKILGDKTEVDSISTEKNVDRYTMTYVFNAKNMGKEKVLAINVSTTNLLYYLSDSEYPAHLVSIDLANKKGNWIDYNQEKIGDDKYTVKIVNDHECQVTITTTKDKLDFSSVGGLNIVTESVQFLYDSIKPRTTVILPTPNQQIRYGHDVVINYSVFDPYLDRVFYRVDGGVEVDVTGLNASFSSYSIGAGVHTINITANDSTGNSNSSFFTINLYEPAPGGAGSGGGDTGEGWDFTIKTRIVNKKSFGSGDMVNVSFNLSNVKPSSLKYYTLQYYLESPSGDKIGNAQETIVVAIPSNTMVYKGLILPQDSTNGLWKAVGFYHPADHLGEVRSDYDSFIVGEEEEDAESVVAGLVNDITPKIREIPAKFVSSIQKNPWMYVIVGGGVFGVLVLVYTIIYTARSLNGGHKRYKKKQ
ncbi:hypothetical protein KKE60_04665, partial [Patescibacteria group bacterium]|nr:hypothetical protein [Patescibacteria group bacterium]